MLAKAAEAYGMPIVLTTSQEDHIQGPLAPALPPISPGCWRAAMQTSSLSVLCSSPTRTCRIGSGATLR